MFMVENLPFKESKQFIEQFVEDHPEDIIQAAVTEYEEACSPDYFNIPEDKRILTTELLALNQKLQREKQS